MNWTIGIDMYTLMCIKLMTNNNNKKRPKQAKTFKKKKVNQAKIRQNSFLDVGKRMHEDPGWRNARQVQPGEHSRARS